MDELNVTSTYLCSVPLARLRLRVTLRRVDGCISSNGISNSATSDNSGHQDREAWVAHVIGWQQKLEPAGSAPLQDVKQQYGGKDGRGSHSRPFGRWHGARRRHVPHTSRKAPLVPPHVFTHTHDEGVLQRTELQRAVVSGARPHSKPGALALAVRADAAAQLVRHSQMFGILADCGALGGRMLLTLMTSNRDGSFDMRPGLSTPGCCYRQQDRAGVLWEWELEVSPGDVAVIPRAARLDFGPPDLWLSEGQGAALKEVEAPERSSLHVLLAGELVAGWGFPRRQLYVEYRILYDHSIWRLLPRGRIGFKDTTHPRPGVIRGVTQVSLPPRFSWRPKAHFAHPLEFEFELLVDDLPAPPFWPTIYFQVCAWRRFSQHTTEGYGWLGTNDHRPVSQRAGVVTGVLSRFRFHAQSCGTLQVRMQQVRRWVQRQQQVQTLQQAPQPADIAVSHRAHLVVQEPHKPLPPRQLHPPVLVLQPADARVMLGRVAEFCVHATGAEPLHYHWSKDGQPLKTSTARTRILCISHAALDDTGDYMCTASNDDGSTDSHVARLVVDEPELPPIAVAADTQTLQSEAGDATQTDEPAWAISDITQTEMQVDAADATQTEEHAAEDSTQTFAAPPRILQQPGDISVMEGAGVELRLKAEGDPPLQYQWLRAGMPLRLHTQSAMQLQAAAVEDADSYACQVWNEQGSVTSEAATLTVHERPRPPLIITQPRHYLEVIEGDPIRLAVAAEGGMPLAYCWQRSGQNLVHQEAAELSIEEAGISDAGTYCCIVSNRWGSTDRNAVNVTVLAAGPAFTIHPEGTHAEKGSPAVLWAQAVARRSFDYRWLRGGMAVPSATTAQLRFRGVSAADGGSYVCQASNRWGVATSQPAVLAVDEFGGEPTFLEHPRDTLLEEGSMLHLSARAEGRGNISLHWLREGEPIPGAVGPALRIQGMSLADIGAFACRATNARGTATSRSAVVSVKPRLRAPHIVQQPQGAEVQEDRPFTLSVSAEGSQPLSYQWQCRGRSLLDATTTELRVQAAREADSGPYACVVSNAAGAATSQMALITVQPRGVSPRILQHPADVSLQDGQPLQLTVGAAGDPPLLFQWLRDGVPLPAECHRVLEAAAIAPGDAGTYSCRVTNAHGSVTSNGASVEVLLPPGRPIILRQPIGCSVAHLSSFGLSVLASGDAPLSYQWWLGSTPVAGATTPILAVAGARKALHQGMYTVQVSNGAGSVVTEAALVEVEALDILSIIEHFVEDRQITFRSLFMQFNRSTELELGPRELEALVAAVYPECLPSEFRHFQVVLDTEGREKYSYKQLMMALKEAKTAGHWLESSPDIRALLSALAVRLQEQGRNFRKVFDAFDVEGEGWLGYEGVAALVRRQLPDISAAELRSIMDHIHLLDKDGDGRLTCDELWEAVRHTPVGPAARRDLRRVAGLAKTPAEKEMALRRSGSVRHK